MGTEYTDSTKIKKKTKQNEIIERNQSFNSSLNLNPAAQRVEK